MRFRKPSEKQKKDDEIVFAQQFSPVSPIIRYTLQPRDFAL